MTKRKTKLTRERLRNELFILWCFLMLFYLTAFLLCMFKAGLDFEQVSKAAWRVAYMFVPVLGAFAGFWFSGDGANYVERKQPSINPNMRWIMFTLNAALHAPVFLFLVFGVLQADFADIGLESETGFSDRVESVMRLLFVIWSISLLPVGWVLRSAPSDPDRTLEGLRS